MERNDDTELLDWLAAQSGVNLVSDDDGRWAISDMGVQEVPLGDHGFTELVSIVSLVPPEHWCDDIREALRQGRERLGP